MEKPAQTVHLKTESRRLDLWLLAGVATAACTIMAGILSTGIGLRYFLQPAGALIVRGGTFGVSLITTTPPSSLFHSMSRVRRPCQ